MKNFKHTKGIWYMNTTKKFMSNKGLAITDINDRLICEVSHNLTELSLIEYEANAKLIASSPKLLKALIKLYSFTLNSKGKYLDVILNECEVAIKEATE